MLYTVCSKLIVPKRFIWKGHLRSFYPYIPQIWIYSWGWPIFCGFWILKIRPQMKILWLLKKNLESPISPLLLNIVRTRTNCFTSGTFLWLALGKCFWKALLTRIGDFTSPNFKIIHFLSSTVNGDVFFLAAL